MGSSDTTTDGIRVQVRSRYVPERSAPTRNLYYFAYQVKIANEGSKAARLVTRHWIIADADDHEEQVRGPGVVGETPRLEPGESFEYTSACPLRTSSGTMRGTFQMVRDDGERFDAVIEMYSLEMPHSLH